MERLGILRLLCLVGVADRGVEVAVRPERETTARVSFRPGDVVEDDGRALQFTAGETVSENALYDSVVLVGLEEVQGRRGGEIRMKRETEQTALADRVRIVDFGEQFDPVGTEAVDAPRTFREVERPVGGNVGTPWNFKIRCDGFDR